MDIRENDMSEVEELMNKGASVGNPLKVQDLSGIADKYLTDKAKEDLSRKAKNSTIKMDNGDCYTLIYFAVRTRQGNEEKGVVAIVSAINELSETGSIHSCLAHI